MTSKLYIGCAGWAISGQHAEHFPSDGTHLARYALRFNAVEINSSFYRPHKPETYARWAASTPAEFRFAVKMPRAITHEARLIDCDAEIEAFVSQVMNLGDKLGPVLVQLPPKLDFRFETVEAFLTTVRERFKGDIACEPRHASWFTPEAEALLTQHRVARVAADPAPHPTAGQPAAWRGLTYLRLHGSPRMYYSSYDASFLDRLVGDLDKYAASGPAWCIFDNTAMGAATENAIAVQERITRRLPRPAS
jgi:uncharacterized protein YecE (DUF72 family)